jgi:hypothetical protein
MSLAKRALALPKGNATRKKIENFLDVTPSINSFEGLYTYTGKSKKIKKGYVTIIEDKGDKAKVKDINGSETIVSKSTLQTTLNM